MGARLRARRPETWSRLHSARLGGSDGAGIEVEIFASEHVDREGLTDVVGPTPDVQLTGADYADCTPSDLRNLAAVLLKAADAADVAFGN